MLGMGKIFSQKWTFLNRTDRRSSKRPAYIRYLPIQPWIDDFKSSRRGENWLARSLWGLRGTPRYVKGKLPSLKPDIKRITCFWIVLTPPKKMDDFCGFISKPDVWPKSDSCRGGIEPNRSHHEREVERHLQKQGDWYLATHTWDGNRSPPVEKLAWAFWRNTPYNIWKCMGIMGPPV